VNRARPGRYCFACGVDIVHAPMSAAGRFHAIQRQTGNGICDRCQRRRHAAAVEYLRASDAVRLMQQLGAARLTSGIWHCPPTMGTAFDRAVQRVQAADAACIALKMWPASRAGIERSTT
jgi:hypothetical protein